MGRLEFEEFLKTLESERKEAKIDWENKKRQFLQAVDELFHFIEECLEPYRNRISIFYEDIEIIEEKIGRYKSRRMVIDIGGRKATLTPVGTIIIAASGRVDLEGETGIVKIVRVPKSASRPRIFFKLSETKLSSEGVLSGQEVQERDVWKIATPPPGIRYIDLDCDLFLDVLMKVMK
jgi:hypothetical protein